MRRTEHGDGVGECDDEQYGTDVYDEYEDVRRSRHDHLTDY